MYSEPLQPKMQTGTMTNNCITLEWQFSVSKPVHPFVHPLTLHIQSKLPTLSHSVCLPAFLSTLPLILSSIYLLTDAISLPLPPSLRHTCTRLWNFNFIRVIRDCREHILTIPPCRDMLFFVIEICVHFLS